MYKKLLSFAFIIVINLPSARAATLLDQSFTKKGGGNLASFINECCQFVAQTFTAGLSGKFESVRINVQGIPQASSQLRVSLWSTKQGIPQDTILSTILPSGTSLISNKIIFPDHFNIHAGSMYALIVNYVKAPPPGFGGLQGFWDGNSDNQYSGGEMLAYDNQTNQWTNQGEGFDVFFETYVIPTPIPASIWLLFSGLVGLLSVSRKKNPKLSEI
jgi:hypothetical protein